MLRADLYQGLADAVATGDADLEQLGCMIVLPSSYTGGTCYMHQLYQDSMAIVHAKGGGD
jgi:hypothetical protein